MSDKVESARKEVLDEVTLFSRVIVACQAVVDLELRIGKQG